MQQRAGEEVFESPDFIEDDELLDKKIDEEFIDQDIIAESLKPILAFQEFGGQVFDPHGDTGKTVVYSSGVPEQFESPLQKFRRLKQELSLFSQELEDLSQQAPETSDAIPEVAREIREELQTLWHELEKQKQTSKLFTETLQNEDVLTTDTLINELRRFQAQNDEKAGDSDNPQAVYSLFRSQGVSNASQSLAEIQQRIDRIDMVLGKQPEAGFGYADMSSAVSFLVNHLQLLEGEKLESTLLRVKEINTKLGEMEKTEMEETAELLANKSKADRVNEMFELMKKWDVAAEDLPTLVDRLQQLKEVHDASANVVDKVNRLQDQQARIAKLLEEDKQLLQTATKTLSENCSRMHENVQSLDARMKVLLEKLG